MSAVAGASGDRREREIYLPIKTVSITQKEYNKCELNGGLLERHKCQSRLTVHGKYTVKNFNIFA